jgi:hypothetical protein
MHQYEPLWSDDPNERPPGIAGFRFRSALDVVAYAQLWCCIGRTTSPEVWHLDGTGALVSYFRGSSLDSIKTWADNPRYLLHPDRRSLCSAAGRERWLIIDSRPAWRHSPIVDESDVAAYVALRAHLSSADVDLLDAVIFDDQLHWWSLQELTSGAKVLLMSMNTTDLATKQDLVDLRVATKQDLADLKAELKGDFAGLRVEFADFRAEMHHALYQQTRTYITWMFGLLTAYTAMSGSLVAIAAIVIR